MEQFLETWSKMVGDMEERLSDKQMKRIFYEKIKKSEVLRPFLDRFSLMDESDPDHTYAYLFEGMEKHLLRTLKERATQGLAQAEMQHVQGTKGGKGGKNDTTTRAAPAAPDRRSQQCKYWLGPNTVCNNPATCKLGMHDRKFKGKGPAPPSTGGGGGGTGPPTGGRGTGGRGTKGGGKGKPGQTADAPPKNGRWWY